MTVVADSGALYAIYDADDKHHAAVMDTLSRERGAIIVPTVLLAEIDYLLTEFLGVEAELDFLQGLVDGVYTLEPFLPADLLRCYDLLSSYRDLKLGLADASVLATAERLGIQRILTVDERHFRAVKPAKGKLIILPADSGTA